MIKKKLIYIAGPLFSEHERGFLEEITEKIALALGVDPKKDIFLPHRDAGDLGIGGRGREEIFASDIEFLDNAQVIVALLDGPDVDSGTAVELGYAYAQGKEIFGVLTDWRRWKSNNKVENINNMIWGVCGRGNRIYRKIDSQFIQDLKSAINNE